MAPSKGQRKLSRLKRLCRFGLTGLLVTGVHLVVASIAIVKCGWPSPTGNGLAFITATLVSYFINTLWSFKGQLHKRTLARFLGVSALGFSQAMGMALLMERLGFNHYEGILAVALSIPPVSFLLHNLWTYQDRRIRP